LIRFIAASPISRGCCVISVEFRLAPEHKFPVGVDDSASATRWIIENAARLAIDPASVAIPPAIIMRGAEWTRRSVPTPNWLRGHGSTS
jgi:hypothetical protein